MHLGHLLSSTSTLQISSPGVPSSDQFLLDSSRPEQVRAIIAPISGMENNGEVQTAQPPRSCSSPEAPGKSCWSLDLRVAVLLVTLAAAVILLLLYKLLQLRHRLRLARAMNALEYSSFYHSATYRLKHPTACQETTIKNGVIPEDTTPIQTIAAAVSSTVISPPAPPPPALPLPPTPVLPPPPEHRPSTPRVLSLPLPLPLIQTTPPSPHLSWGACSDAEVYSRIGAFRPSRLSSLSSQSTVILFEHSAL